MPRTEVAATGRDMEVMATVKDMEAVEVVIINYYPEFSGDRREAKVVANRIESWVANSICDLNKLDEMKTTSTRNKMKSCAMVPV